MNKDFKARLYQETILNTAAKQNTLVVLPTGLGKTAIAAMLIHHRLKNYPESKILFLAPTKPLAQQHEKTLKQLIPSHEEEITLFTGSVAPSKRESLWREKRIIVATPQGVENDVINRKAKLENISLIVFDEAHRATGDYSYVYIAKKYMETAKHERIIALTASPGTDTETILEVCHNLGIQEIEYRTHDSEDVKTYIQDINVKYVNVELTEDIKRLKTFLDKCYNSKIEEAKQLGYIHSAANNYTKTTLLSIMSGMHAKIAQGEKDFEILKTVSLLAEAMKVQYALELIETQGVYQTKEYLEQLEKQAVTSKVKAVKNLVKDLNFRSALILARSLNEKQVQHPKIDALGEIVNEELEKNKKSKIIIFTQYRDTASEIKKLLQEKKVKAEIFVGQAKKKDTGLTQKKQKEMIERFENNDFQCLIATSVGEEGLDIPEVDLVVFYEPIPSAIRTVQRRGRTGRQKAGRVIMIIAKGTRDEAHRWSAHHKERKMYTHLDNIKKTLHDHLKDKPKTIQDYSEDKKTIVKVDYREKGSSTLKALLEMNTNIELRSLEIGDYLLSDEVVIEYKTVKDFVDSIIDGRLLSQAKDLRQYRKPLIVVEGEEDVYAQRRIHPNAIRGMIAALTINLGIPIITTKNPKDTASLLKVIADREQDPDKKDFQLHTHKPMTDKEIQEYIISGFPGIGSRIAPYLLEHFNSIKNIVNASEHELREVELIGEKKAKRLKELFDKEYRK